VQGLDSQIVETLLSAGEGSTLDYKSQQYKFAGASHAEKSLLLKDVLAMANAWKTGDAHILTGVKENPDGRAVVVGITDHIDDSRLQEFVNAKTNVPVEFAYRTSSADGKTIGVLTIAAIQQRPVWLKKPYADLEHERVYIRRGSSTAVATPDEIAKMGEARFKKAEKYPAGLTVRRNTSRRGPERHDYQLVIELKNDGSATLSNWNVRVEMPRAILVPNLQYAVEVRNEGSPERAVFRLVPERPNDKLYPGAVRAGTIEYHMDRELHRNVELQQELIAVAAYVNDELVAETSLQYDEWQDFR
jgi:hypothetical protein